jgi:hypothetical protein
MLVPALESVEGPGGGGVLRRSGVETSEEGAVPLALALMLLDRLRGWERERSELAREREPVMGRGRWMGLDTEC